MTTTKKWLVGGVAALMLGAVVYAAPALASGISMSGHFPGMMSGNHQAMHATMMAGNPDMAAMHASMMAGNPDMAAMHGSMMAGNPDMAAMHEECLKAQE